MGGRLEMRAKNLATLLCRLREAGTEGTEMRTAGSSTRIIIQSRVRTDTYSSGVQCRTVPSTVQSAFCMKSETKTKHV